MWQASNYWSSTTNANNPNNAWIVNFNNGNVNNNNKDNNNYVRAVRAGKCSLLSFRSIHDAYMDCRRRKRGTVNAARFEYRMLDNLFELAADLQKGAYQPSRSVCFVTQSPKPREIFAADFRDRVVHHLLVRELEKLWEPRFIHDSFACRVGKGTHAAVERLQSFMRQATKNGTRAASFLQLDIRSFFMSIDKRILFNLMSERLRAVWGRRPDMGVIVNLLARIVFHDCTQDFVFKGDPHRLETIPDHKTLFKTGPDKGLPIGNLTSQFFANVYLNELDLFVKQELRCRFYLRYVDDFILLSASADELCVWKDRIEAFLGERLALTLKPGSRIKRVSEGADFLGYIVRPDYILARRRVVNNLKAKLAWFCDSMISEMIVGTTKVRKVILTPERVVQVRQVLASYLGHFSHARTFRLVAGLFRKHAWLHTLFYLHDGRLIERLAYKGVFRSLKAQVGFFRQRLPGYCLLVQVGKCVEAYGSDALLLREKLGLAAGTCCRGNIDSAGFPVRVASMYVRKIAALGRSVCLIAEGQQGRYVKDRYVREMYQVVPAAVAG